MTEDKKDNSINLDETLVNEPIVEKHYTVTHAFFIAGVRHHQMNEVMDVLKEGMTLELIPEPTNKFDPNAVKIIFEGFRDEKTELHVMLGYVPKKFSSEIVAKFAAGRTLECVIVGFYPTNKAWERCYVEVRQIDNEG